jgi:hypothetical protein
MRTFGETVQSRSWESMLESLVAESGGLSSAGIQHHEEILDQDKTERVEGWLQDLIAARKRDHHRDAEPAPVRTSSKRQRAESSFGEDAAIQ